MGEIPWDCRVKSSPEKAERQRLAGVLLAAGSSTRLGQPKQLITINSVPLVARVAKQVLNQCDAGLIVVTGANHEAVIEALNDLPVRAVYNPNWREGMASSIRSGVAVVVPAARAILLMVCDQPLINEADIARMAKAWKLESDRIVAAGYAGICGTPAIFPCRLRASLLNLQGERGAKSIIDDAPSVSVVDMPNAEFDVDTMDDLENLKI